MTERLTPIARTRGYWESLRTGDDLPDRADVDPRALPGALANAFLIERVVPGITRFRLAGGLLSDMMGMDVRGMPFLSIIEPDGRTSLAPHVDRVFDDPGILDMALEGAASFGRGRMSARLTLLPLRSLRGVDLALGCMEAEGAPGTAPRRLRLIRCIHERIGATGVTAAAGFAEPPAPFQHAPGRPNLRLVHSSDQKMSGTSKEQE